MSQLYIVSSLFFLTSLVYGDTLPVTNGEFPCIDDAVATRYMGDFQIDIDTFGGKELCKPKSEAKMLFDALTLIEKGDFATGGSNVFLKGLVGDHGYYDWMKKETRGMRRGNDNPIATAYNSMGYFTLQDGWVALASLGRVGTLIHEARHTEGYYHIVCTHGPYQGTSVSGCDSSLGYGGSHGVEMEYYARVVVQGKNFHPAYQSMARLMALGRGNFVFNQSPIKSREALALIDAQDHLILFDGNKMITRATPLVGDKRLKRTSFGATLFYPGSALALDLYSTSQKDFALQDDYSYFKFMRRPDHIGENAIDLQELDLGTNRYMTALQAGGTLLSYRFGKGEWSAPSTPIQDAVRVFDTSPSGEHGVFVLTQNQKLYPYDPASLKVGSALNISWPELVLNYATFSGKLLSLEQDGVVYLLQGTKKEPFKPLEQGTFMQMIGVPLYDAFEVVPDVSI